MKRIYLDYAATTPVDPRVFSAMRPYFSEKFGNPGSVHRSGQEAIAALDGAREKIAKVIDAKFGEIIFTASVTEANNLVLRGMVKIFGTSRATTFQNRSSHRSSGDERSALSAENPAQGGNLAFLPPRASSKWSSLDPKIFVPRVIVSGIEHESILETAKDLEKDGVEVIYLPVNQEGMVDLKKLKAALNERTVLVSIMYANNEVGTIQPIAEIAEMIEKLQNSKNHDRNNLTILQSFNHQFPLFHTDASQAFQYLNCDVNTLGVDLMTLSSHKIYGPKGAGALYIRGKKLMTNNYQLMTMMTGGGQEYGLRSGTENVPAIVGFGKAVELLTEYAKEPKRIGELRDYFWARLKKIKPRTEINGSVIHYNKREGTSPASRLPNNLNVYFPDSSSEKMLVKLDMLGIEASAGSACAARSLNESYILRALGYGERRAKSSIRFSLGRQTTKGKIDEALGRMKNI
ncbi:MAG: cysteine desulfurase family protein [bacterium]|nr:cysteine desulfurase family protein [bacterium]